MWLFLRFFAGKTGKILVLFLVLFGFSVYFYYLHMKLESLQKEIVRIETLKNELENELDMKERQLRLVRKNYEVLLETTRKLSNLERKLGDGTLDKRIDRIIDGGRQELLLEYLNRNVECWVRNYGKDGKCVRGKWYDEKD